MIDYELTGVRGDTWVGPGFRWKDKDGVVVPLASAAIQVRRSADAADAIVTLTLGDGITQDGDGILWPAMTPEQTKRLRPTDVYDLEVVTESGQRETLVGGLADFAKDVTRV